MIVSYCGRLWFAVMMIALSLSIPLVGYAENCTNVAVADFMVDVPPADPEDYSKPPPPPSNLPNLVSAKTGKSSPNLSATVVIEKSNQDEDTNQKVHLGNLYCGIKTKNTENVKIGSFENKCILYDGKKAGNDPPVVLSSKKVSSLSGGAKTTTHHSFNVKSPSYYTLYGCANTGTNPPKETKTSDNCGTTTFLAYGIPDVRVQSVAIQGGGTSFPAGATITVVTDLANGGDNFIAGKNRKMTVSAELSGCVPTRTADALEMSDDILSSGASGKTKTFTVTIPPTATPGTCTVTIVADPKEELLQSPNKEENRSNNSKSITFQVIEPQPPTPAPPVISVTSVTLSNGTSYVYTDEKVDVSIGVKNSGGNASSPMTGRMFMTPIAGGQETTIGTFSLDAIPAGGTATGVIPGVFFVGDGEVTLKVCFGEGSATCWDGGTLFIELRQPAATDEDLDSMAIRMLLGERTRNPEIQMSGTSQTLRLGNDSTKKIKKTLTSGEQQPHFVIFEKILDSLDWFHSFWTGTSQHRPSAWLEQADARTERAPQKVKTEPTAVSVRRISGKDSP